MQRRQVDRKREELIAVGRDLQHLGLKQAHSRAPKAPILLNEAGGQARQWNQLSALRKQAVAPLPPTLDRCEPSSQKRAERRVSVTVQCKRGHLGRRHGCNDGAANTSYLALTALQRRVPSVEPGWAQTWLHCQHATERCDEVRVAT